jgi:hypothetical protein
MVHLFEVHPTWALLGPGSQIKLQVGVGVRSDQNRSRSSV